MGTFTHRHLPHWQPAKRVFFITYRLHGSLPRHVIERLQSERDRLRALPPLPGESKEEKAGRNAKRVFAMMDDALDEVLRDSCSSVVRWLAREDIALLVRNNLYRFEGTRYRLHRYVIMPNHVHLLIEPLPLPEWMKMRKRRTQDLQGSDRITMRLRRGERKQYWPLDKILKTAKGYTGLHANRILGRHGPFWQQESYDHWVRDREEYGRILNYIDRNPVKARLCSGPSEWRWSTAGEAAADAGLDPT